MRPRHFLVLVPAFLLLWQCGVTCAADAWPVPRGPSREPQPYKYDPATLKSVPKDFLDDAQACILYAGTTHLVEPDGTIETITHEVIRLNGRKAIEKVGEYRGITFDPGFEKCTLNEVKIHKPGGKVIEVEPLHAHLRDVGTDYLVYDPDKQLVISFPSLEVGDTVEVKWTVRGKNPEHGGQFFTRYWFGDTTHPIVRDELKVRVPKAMKLTYAAVNGRIDPVLTEADEHKLYHWKGENLAQLPRDEDRPSSEDLRASVTVSTFPSWEAIGQWKAKLRQPCWECTDDVRARVKEVTKGMTDPEAKARALTYWVRRNIRYVSTGETHHYTPYLPGKVLANRAGDCKDGSQLLAVMLREVGLKVELATLGTRDDGQVHEAVPSPWGTHAILLVTIGDQEHWVDTTVSLAKWNFLPNHDRDRLCYLVDEKGNCRLKRTPPRTVEENRVDQTTEMWIGTDGSTRCRRVEGHFGTQALFRRDDYMETPSGERRRKVASMLQDSNSKTRLTHLSFDEFQLNDFDRPVTVEMTFEVPGQFSGSPEMDGSFTDSKVWSKLLSFNVDYDRKVPLELPVPFESKHRYVIHLPPGYQLERRPRNKSMKSPWGTFTVKVKPTAESGSRVVDVEYHLRLEKELVKPEQFAEFRAFQDEVSRAYRTYLTLVPSTEAEDALLLEAILRLAPQDAGTAATLARLYVKRHQYNDARRVLKKATHYNPDDAGLWEMAVRAATTDAEEEMAQFQLVRLFPDDPKQVLALAAVQISAGKYDEAKKLLDPVLEKGAPAAQADAHYQLARIHHFKREYEKSLEMLEKGARIDPVALDTVRVYQLHGRVLEKLGRLKDAEKAHEKALAINAEAEQSLEALIHLAIAQDNRDRAMTYLRKYVLVVGDEVSGLLLAANYYLRLGRYDDAFDLASKAREQRFHADTQRILGLVYLQRREYKQAVAHLEKASLDNAEVLEALLRAHLRLGNLNDVAEKVDLAAKLPRPPANLTATLTKARAVLARRDALVEGTSVPKEKAAAIKRSAGYLALAEQASADGRTRAEVEALLNVAFSEGIQLGPLYSFRGRMELERGRLHRALDDAARAQALNDGDWRVYYVRGRVRLEQDKNGLDDLKKAADLTKHGDADVLHALASAYFQQGQVDEALAAQREAVKLKPADTEMQEQLRELEKAAKTGD